MIIRRHLSISFAFAMVSLMTAPATLAQPGRARHAERASAAARPVRACRIDEEAFKVLKLTAIEDGVRVDYAFVRSGAATWTNMNRPLLRQFGVRVGATICLPRGPDSSDTIDFD